MTMHEVGIGYEIEMHVWAEPGPGISLDDLVTELIAIGNQVLEIDAANQRVLIAFARE